MDDITAEGIVLTCYFLFLIIHLPLKIIATRFGGQYES